MEQSMRRAVTAHRLPDVTVSMKPQRLDAAQLAALSRLSNVTAVEPRSLFATRVWVGERRERAIVIGVRDYAHQRADVVTLRSGAAPVTRQLLTDRNNKSAKGFAGGPGATARVIAADGGTRSLPITGTGSKLTGGQDDPSNDWITFYTNPETVATLSGASGYTSLGFRLRDASRPAAERTVAAIRDQLRAT